MSTTFQETGKCRWCGMIHGPLCPSVKSIEYFADGGVKRVEFKVAADHVVPNTAPPLFTWHEFVGN